MPSGQIGTLQIAQRQRESLLQRVHERVISRKRILQRRQYRCLPQRHNSSNHRRVVVLLVMSYHRRLQHIAIASSVSSSSNST